MANQILKKFIGDKQIDADKILLDNNTALKSKNSTGLIEKDLIKLNGSDEVVITDVKDPMADSDAANKKYVDDQVAGGGQALQDHIDDAVGAHAASAISVSAISNLAATDVQGALAELQGDIDGIDATYVNVTGDTMTGTLVIDKVSGPTAQIAINSSSASTVLDDQQLASSNSLTISANAPLPGEKLNISCPANVSINTPSMVFGDAPVTPGQASPSQLATINAYVDMSLNNISNATRIQAEEGFTANSEEFNTPNASFNYSSMFGNSAFQTGSVSYDGSGNPFDLSSTTLNNGLLTSYNDAQLFITSYRDLFDNGVFQFRFNDLTTTGRKTNIVSVTDISVPFNPPDVGSVSILTDSGNTSGYDTGSIDMITGSATDANSGDINLMTGTVSGIGSNRGEITLDSALVTVKSNADMDGNKVVDVMQLEGLSAASISGNALRFDELGVYSVGAGYGIASLGADGKIPAEQLPAAIMEYKGTWDASTNTPTLANGTPANAPEDAGHLYKVSVGGTVDFGAGPITFNAGDQVILSASLIWEKSTDANLVTSVNGAQGVVVLDADDLTYHQVNASDWTVLDDSSIKMTLDEVGARLTANEGDIAAVTDDVSHLVTLSGVAADSDSLGVFTGVTISDNQTVKSALQDLETAHEAHLNDSSDAHAASAISYDNSITVLPATTVQGAIDEILSVTSVLHKKPLTSLEITNKYIELIFEAYDYFSMDVYVDRLALHQDTSWVSGDTTIDGDDYRVEVIPGVGTKIHFLNDLVSPGNQQLQVGDNIYVRYKYKA